MRQVAIGRWPAMSFPAAIVAWEALREQRDKGRDLALEHKLKREQDREAEESDIAARCEMSYTVALMCDDYLSGHIERNRKPKGAAEVARMFDKMIGGLADVPAVDVSRAMAFGLINRWAQDAPVQAVNLRRELGAALDFAIDAGRVPETTPNWWRLILRGKIRSKGRRQGGVANGAKNRVLDEGEIGELLRWLPNFSLTVADVLTLYLWTSTRGAEIVAMTGAEIVDESGQLWWVIPKAKTKNADNPNASDHRVPLFGRAAAIIERRKKLYGNDILFPARNKDGHISQKAIQTQVHYRQPYCQTRPKVARHRLPVSHWAPHDLRRTSRTLLAKLGCPDAVGESILGHMLPGVVGVYNRHQYDAERVEWLGKLSQFLEKLAN